MDVVYGALLREYAVGSEVPIRIEGLRQSLEVQEVRSQILEGNQVYPKVHRVRWTNARTQAYHTDDH